MQVLDTYGFAAAAGSDLEAAVAVAVEVDATGGAVEEVAADALGLSLKISLIFFHNFFKPFFSFFGGCICSVAIIGERGWNA